MNATTKMMAKALLKTVLCVAVVAGTLTFASGCDDYLGYGSGFRFGNFNQGLQGHLDCRKNPWDPRC